MSKRRVLIVDDDEDLRQLTRITIEDACTIVGEATNGAEALERAEELRPDVVVIDMKMPVMDGVEATKLLKYRFPEMQVIVVSGSDDPDHVNAAHAAGATYSVDKMSIQELPARLGA